MIVPAVLSAVIASTAASGDIATSDALARFTHLVCTGAAKDMRPDGSVRIAFIGGSLNEPRVVGIALAQRGDPLPPPPVGAIAVVRVSAGASQGDWPESSDFAYAAAHRIAVFVAARWAGEFVVWEIGRAGDAKRVRVIAPDGPPRPWKAIP